MTPSLSAASSPKPHTVNLRHDLTLLTNRFYQSSQLGSSSNFIAFLSISTSSLMAVSCAFSVSSFAGAKRDSLFLRSSYSSSYSPQIRVLRGGCNFSGRILVDGGASFNPRCEAAREPLVQNDDVDSSRLSSLAVLEQLKTSVPDRYTKERSSIVVIGLSVHSTPVDMREKLAIPEAEWPRAIGELCALNHIEEAAVLSTCNRMELYVVALSQQRGVKEVTEWMSKTSGIPVSDLCEHRFLKFNKDATRHLFEVSAGLDSLVLGEGQILSQVKHVVKTGQGIPGFGRNISGLFKHAITVGKRVRTETNISVGAISVSSAAVELALTKLPESSLPLAKILVIGAGKMGKLVIKHLAAKGVTKLLVVNRSESKVKDISEELKNIEVVYRPFSEMVHSASVSDVIFTSTASETPLLVRPDVEGFSPVGPTIGGVRLFVDISVPRNVGTCVSEISGSRVYNVDDLKEVVEANKEDRALKSMEAKSIINEESSKFEAWRDSLETVPTIKKLRGYAERIRIAELEKCLGKIGGEDVPKKLRRAVEDLSRGIVNKLLHGPMQHLRCDGSEKRTLTETLENMHALNRMFDLETEASVLEEKIRAKVEQNLK